MEAEIFSQTLVPICKASYPIRWGTKIRRNNLNLASCN
jgi:hypothetical protein